MENSQANSIMKQMHQLIANLVCKFNLKNNYLEEDEI